MASVQYDEVTPPKDYPTPSTSGESGDGVKPPPVIVVSNRLPFNLQRTKSGALERCHSAGGLVTAVAPAVVQCKGLWLGWSGLHDLKKYELIPPANEDDQGPSAALSSSQIVPVHVNPQDFASYYNGCCNSTFWPLFHSMQDKAVFERGAWKAYCRVNDEFAYATLQTLRKVLKELDAEGSNNTPIIWIHDYHLITMATTIRKIADKDNLRCIIGFFLHIPFPSWDILRIFPWDDEILSGMLACDVVGFHTKEYCFNFLKCCQNRLRCQVDFRNLMAYLPGRTVHIMNHPIGIPYHRFEQLANRAPAVLKDTDKVQVILGVDRLDYTKGLLHRVRAFEKLLESHPELMEKVQLLQVAVPTRVHVQAYKTLKVELDQLIGRVNGRFSRVNWTPIRYINQCLGQDELAGLYRDAAVALVTPLIDGMNLVAKEFVACQVEDPGVLVLSPFAGAAVLMTEALPVNPYNIDLTARTIHKALTMPLQERQERMKKLQDREMCQDSKNWTKTFIDYISYVYADDEESNV